MAADAKNIFAAEPQASGVCFMAPLGTPGPTSATDSLNVAFVDLGHLGEDGITETTDRSVDKKKNFGGKTVKVLQTDYSHTFKFTLMESLNADVLKAVYGEDNVTVTPANGSHGTQVEVKKNSKKLPRKSWVFDTVDTENDAYTRDYIPEGQVISLGDVVRVHNDTIVYEVELECFENAEGDNVVTYTDDGQLAGS